MTLRGFGKAANRALRLRCPRCGEGELFRGIFAMYAQCSGCGLTYEREPGYFVGAIYINYAATAIPTIAGFLLLDTYTSLSLTVQILMWSAFGVAFPLCFYRHSKSLWLAVDHFLNPEEPPLRVVARRNV